MLKKKKNEYSIFIIFSVPRGVDGSCLIDGSGLIDSSGLIDGGGLVDGGGLIDVSAAHLIDTHQRTHGRYGPVVVEEMQRRPSWHCMLRRKD